MPAELVNLNPFFSGYCVDLCVRVHHEHVQPSTGHGQPEAGTVHQRDQVRTLFIFIEFFVCPAMRSIARCNMLFSLRSHLSNEMNYIKAHPFSAVNLGAGSEVCPQHRSTAISLFFHVHRSSLCLTQVRYIAPVFPWNDPKFARPPVSSLEVPKASAC